MYFVDVDVNFNYGQMSVHFLSLLLTYFDYVHSHKNFIKLDNI